MHTLMAPHWGLIIFSFSISIRIIAQGDVPLAPDPTAVGVSKFYIGSPGNFLVRSCDLFLDDGTNYDQNSVVSNTPFELKAIYPYDMDIDPVLEGDPIQKLTRAGENKLLKDTLDRFDDLIPCDTILVNSNEDDPVLFIDLAAIYDDQETDLFGGFWGNFKLFIYPMFWDGTHWEFLMDNSRTWLFSTPIRGPFWSGEKLEVGDTEVGFMPQIMHYQNFGIWNWKWLPDADAVLIVFQEGDGGWWDDTMAEIIVTKVETINRDVFLSDRGHEVSLSLTNEGHLKRVVTDISGLDNLGRPRIRSNEDNHDIDVKFRTRPLKITSSYPFNHKFFDKFVIGKNVVRGGEVTQENTWEQGINIGNNDLKYIDNISYIPGWDWCGGLGGSYDTEDDFQFEIFPNNDTIVASNSLGGSDCITTLFFRSTHVRLPEFVLQESSVMVVYNNETKVINFQKIPGYNGFIFTELLAYKTNGGDEFGFRIEKSTSSDQYTLIANSFDGNVGSYIVVRVTSLQWPSDEPVFSNHIYLSTQSGNYGTGHLIKDLPLLYPGYPYMVINEILVYDPAGDDDMSWTTYFEALPYHISFQLSSSNNPNSNAYVASDCRIIQFVLPGSQPEFYVDHRNLGYENGSKEFPWNTVKEGIDFVPQYGGEVRIFPGNYNEQIQVNKKCTLVNSENSGQVKIGE